MVKPDLAIITTVQIVHLENLGTPENIAKAKAEIMEGVPKGGTVFLNRDNKFFKYHCEIAETRSQWVFSFGNNVLSDSHIKEFHYSSSGISAKLSILDEEVDIDFSFFGKHHVVNSLMALMAVKFLSYDLYDAAQALSYWTPGPGRGRMLQIPIAKGQPPVTVLDECYNASPVAMRAAFEVFSLVPVPPGGRRIAILGDMAELGSNRVYIHGELALPLERAGVDIVYTTGPLMKNLYENLLEEFQGEHFNNPGVMAHNIPKIVQPGDLVLVKGSRGDGVKPKMQIVVEALMKMAVR
jgi:UDP-N-acetylmuramyl pentapeptide synthase